MKKNNGLTLAELLVIIVVIGLLITVSSVSVTNIMKNTKRTIKKQEMTSLYDGAKSYFTDVVNGDASYKFDGLDPLSGYDFLVKISDTSFCRDKYVCKTIKDDLNFTTTIYLKPSTDNFAKYIQSEKYNLDSCTVKVDINYSKNKYGYLELTGIDVTKGDSVKVDKCVK